MNDSEPISLYGDPFRYRELLSQIGDLQHPWAFWADLVARMPVAFLLPVLLLIAGMIDAKVLIVLLAVAVLLLTGCLIRFRMLTARLLYLHQQAVLAMPYSVEPHDPDA